MEIQLECKMVGYCIGKNVHLKPLGVLITANLGNIKAGILLLICTIVSEIIDNAAVHCS